MVLKSRRVFLLLGSLMVAALLSAASIAVLMRRAPADRTDPAAVDPLQVAATIDYGRIEPGLRSVALPLTNASDKTIVITSVSSSCSCVVPVAPKSIPAKGRVELKLNLRVSVGPGSAAIAISTTEGASKSISARWIGSGPPTITPASVTARSRTSETIERELEVSFFAMSTSDKIEWEGFQS